MPRQFPDSEELDRVIGELKRCEMHSNDLPPHFGAWCHGNLNNNCAYVSFLPNTITLADNIAVNMSFWGMSRAQIANATIELIKR